MHCQGSIYFGRTPDYQGLNGAHFKVYIMQRECVDIHFDDYDFGNIETIRIFQASTVRDKVMMVPWLEPRNRHFE